MNFHRDFNDPHDCFYPDLKQLKRLQYYDEINQPVRITAIRYKFNANGLCAIQLRYSNGMKTPVFKTDDVPEDED